eukprot:TRINITY_DN1033_c0_g2_i4.p1 TRINITY_DN1033_c0_g2~~TRINITY_DN1033_c0_g2_i4.p1  ORF type:complete len:524 (+),score=94.91 TRINITY_DN1033_c0_g2_i4:229-1800(+)
MKMRTMITQEAFELEDLPLMGPLSMIFSAWSILCCLTVAGAACGWHRRRVNRMREAADLAVAIRLSMSENNATINDHGNRPAGSPPPSTITLSHGSPAELSRQDSSVPQAEPPSMKEIEERKTSLSAGSLFQMKRDWLVRELTKGRDGGRTQVASARVPGKLLMVVIRRSQIFQDSYLQLASVSDEDLRNPLSVHFVGEVGRDDGGVTRDWYSALSKEIVNPSYALFTASASDNYTFQVNPSSDVNPDHLDFFRFIGTVIGKAIFDTCLLDANFTRLFYKRILDRPVTYHDMATMDIQFYNSLVWILENNLDEQDLSLSFSFTKEVFGAYEDVELKAGGKDIPVTEENKREYVDLLVTWRLKESVELQFAAMRAGLSRVVDLTLLQHFDDVELEFLVGGVPVIDAKDWRKNTVYKSGYSDTPDCQTIQWFWQLVENWDQEEKARLLQFVTGTSKVPFPDGFKGLRSSDGPRLFHIVRISDITRLPQAHTCFNELILPDYGSLEELAMSLHTSIYETGNQFQLR